MSDFWKYIKNIFKAAEESSPNQPVIHELIIRTDEEQKDYDYWKETLVRRRLSDWLNQQYAIYKVLPNDIDEGLNFLNTPSSKGFAIHFHQTQYSKRDAVHFMDYLKERVLSLNYRTQISDARVFNRTNWVEAIQRHYLKPRINFEEGKKTNQKFGNITIELVFRNDIPYQLKFQATTYSDSLYKDASDFSDLMNHL